MNNLSAARRAIESTTEGEAIALALILKVLRTAQRNVEQVQFIYDPFVKVHGPGGYLGICWAPAGWSTELEGIKSAPAREAAKVRRGR